MGGFLGENIRRVQPPPPAALLTFPSGSHMIRIKDPEAREVLGDFLDFDDAEELQLFVDHVFDRLRLPRTWSEESGSPDPSDQSSAPPGSLNREREYRRQRPLFL
jgi:hypothetical protein